MSVTEEQDVLTVALTGRIDSGNAAELEAEIGGLLEEGPGRGLVLDLKELEYMSSAGLRVLLRLRKLEPRLRLVNASAEVYEILNLTGFTEMIPVEKAYRTVSIQGCEVIGRGSNGTVYRIDQRTGAITMRIGEGSEATEAVLPRSEQIPGEELAEGQRARVYVVEVRRSTRGVQVLISRSHPGLVRRLFELEVPEIFDGTVEIHGIAREAGSRSKISVGSAEPDVDAIGACVGPRGARVAAVVNELGGEKIDIIEYSEDPATYIAHALAPATVLSVTMEDDNKTCRVVVPENQLSLAIGREGQNARLAAKLTGFKIDIKSDDGMGVAAE